MKPRTRAAHFILTDAQDRAWRATWQPGPGLLTVSLSNGRRAPRTAFALEGHKLANLVVLHGKVAGPPIQTEISMP